MKFLSSWGRLVMGVLFSGLSISPAHASLYSIDYVQNSGDNWITRDSESGLEWLDVLLTVGQTYDQVRTGRWYQSGFRHATRSELQDLFRHSGLENDEPFSPFARHAEALALAELLGPTIFTRFRVSTYGFVGSDYFGRDITLVSNPIGVRFEARLGKIDYLLVPGLPPIGYADFGGGQPQSDEASDGYGSFLVRTVPEPDSMALALVGLLALLAYRREPERLALEAGPPAQFKRNQ